MAGRKTKLNPEVQDRIVQALEAGNYFDASCEFAGVTSRTGYHWLERGQAEIERRDKPNVREGTKQWKTEEIFLQFFHAVTQASANVEIRTIAEIQKQSREDWRAAAWFMEHRYPKKWGKQYSESKNETELTGNLTWEQLFKRGDDDTPTE